jgi:Fe-S oxidoreductase
MKEGGLEAPTRHPIEWQGEDFWDEDKLNAELERVFDICHGCRRCVSLCDSFPTLFDLVDESPTFELDGVDKADYAKVVDQCYLCDLCYQTKCPYIPPHPWQLDYPHLMLRAKAVAFRKNGASLRDRVLTSTTRTAKALSIPLVDVTVNAANRNPALRKGIEKTFGIHHKARVPEFHSRHLAKRLKGHRPLDAAAQPALPTRGKVAIFGTCYGSYNQPQIGEDLVRVLEHNGIPSRLLAGEQCCGMPKMELGDLESVRALKEHNVPLLLEAIDDGWDILAPIPSCVLMFKQELPLLFAEDADVQRVREHVFDPFEYLAYRHKAGLLNTDFKQPLGKVSYQVACHQRVQNIGPKTRDILSLVPDTEVKPIERCSGHDGTYAVRAETYDKAQKILRPVTRQVQQFDPAHYTSDCPMAAAHIADSLGHRDDPAHPISLLRLAYGI